MNDMVERSLIFISSFNAIDTTLSGPFMLQFITYEKEYKKKK